MTSLDWVVMAAYGAVVLAIGWWANRRQTDADIIGLAQSIDEVVLLVNGET